MNNRYPQGSLFLVKIKEAIYNWIENELKGVIEGEHIIWRNQSEPLPGRPCVTMKITDGPRPVGSLDIETPLPSGKLAIGGQRVMTVSIQIFGNTKIHRPMAYQLGIDLHSSLSKQTVRIALDQNGIGVQDRGDVSNISALEETEYEERAQFDVLFGVAQNIVDDPGTIDHVNVDGTVSQKPVHVHIDGP